MAQLQVEKISNATLAINGSVIFGGPNEVALESLKAKTLDYNALGMLGTVELFAGFEKMSATVKLNHCNADVAAKFGDPTTSMQLQIRTNKEKFTTTGRSAEVPFVYKLTATPKTWPGIANKAQEMAEFEVELSVSSITLEENGVEIHHFNAFTNELRVNGVDKTAAFRANLGI